MPKGGKGKGRGRRTGRGKPNWAIKVANVQDRRTSLGPGGSSLRSAIRSPLRPDPVVGVLDPGTEPPAAGGGAAVLSTEYVETTISAAGTVKDTYLNLSKGQDYTNCVPFLTRKATSTANSNDEMAARHVRLAMVDNGGTPAVRVRVRTQRGPETCGISVVEFDPAKVKVQQFIVTGDANNIYPDTTIDAVDLAKTWVIGYGYDNATGSLDDSDHIAHTYRLKDSTTLEVRRATGIASHYCTSNVYIVEDIDGDLWDVQTGTLTLLQSSGNYSENDAITPVDLDRSIVLGCHIHWYSTSGRTGGYVRFIDNETVRYGRTNNNASDSVCRWQVIQFSESSGCKARQADYHSAIQAGATNRTKDTTVAALDTSDDRVTCSTGFFGGYDAASSETGWGAGYNTDVFFEMVDSTTLRATWRETNTSNYTSHCGWALEWGLQ